jgi:anti-sigma B factor antagonist
MVIDRQCGLETAMESRFFKIALEQDVATVDVLRDRLTEEDNIEQFGQELTSLVEKQKVSKIILNMEHVKYFTSSAIGKLIMLHRKMSRSDGEMVLTKLSPEVQEILETSQLLNYFNRSDDQASGAAG